MKINIRYIISKSRIRKDGKASILCRITYLEKRKEFATGIFVILNYWNSKKQKVLDKEEHSTYSNTQLSLIKQKVNEAFLMLQIQKKEFNVNDVYSLYKGEKPKDELGVIEYHQQYLKKIEKLIGVEIQQSTWNKFKYIKKDLSGFVFWKYKKKDLLLSKLNKAFIDDYEYYLKTEKHKKQITINKDVQRFKKVIKSAYTYDLIPKYPFHNHKPKKVVNKVVYLNTEELSRLENYTFSQIRLEQVKDMFVFCCYTGLAYLEMRNLRKKDINTGFDGVLWINIVRKKTSKTVSIPLLKPAKAILDKYKSEDSLLPIISNQRFNSYLKEIAMIIEIEKNLTHHIARKTFATTVLLYNDVPMEIVSELLGHSSMTTTQAYYGKIVKKKVSMEMIKLARKL